MYTHHFVFVTQTHKHTLTKFRYKIVPPTHSKHTYIPTHTKPWIIKMSDSLLFSLSLAFFAALLQKPHQFLQRAKQRIRESVRVDWDTMHTRTAPSDSIFLHFIFPFFSLTRLVFLFQSVVLLSSPFSLCVFFCAKISVSISMNLRWKLDAYEMMMFSSCCHKISTSHFLLNFGH